MQKSIEVVFLPFATNFAHWWRWQNLKMSNVISPNNNHDLKGRTFICAHTHKTYYPPVSMKWSCSNRPSYNHWHCLCVFQAEPAMLILVIAAACNVSVVFAPRPAVCFLPAFQASWHTHTHSFWLTVCFDESVLHPNLSVSFSQW